MRVSKWIWREVGVLECQWLHTEQQNLFTFSTSRRKCSLSLLTGGCSCCGRKENPGKRQGNSPSWAENRRRITVRIILPAGRRDSGWFRNQLWIITIKSVIPVLIVAAGRPQRARGAAGVRGERLRAREAPWVLPGLQGDGQEHHALQGGGHRGHHRHRGGAGPEQQHDTGVSSPAQECFPLSAWVWEVISFFCWLGCNSSLNISAFSSLCCSALACSSVYPKEIPGGPLCFWDTQPKILKSPSPG